MSTKSHRLKRTFFKGFFQTAWYYRASLFHVGVVCKIDGGEIDVAFDMGFVKKYALECKNKIVLDRKALPNELVQGTPVLVRLVRRRALYKGKLLFQMVK